MFGEWAIWFAVAALVVGGGKFLDDYHIRTSTKSKAREYLVRAFLWLDAKTVPDLGGAILLLTRRLLSLRAVIVMLAALLFATWATMTAFYVGRAIYGPPHTEGYLLYIANWLTRSESLFWGGFLTALVVPSTLGLIVTASWFRSASDATTGPKRITFLAVGLLLGAGLALSGTALLLATLGTGGYRVLLIPTASVAATALPAVLFIVTISLMFVRCLLYAGQRLALNVFDVASAPATSPFTYLFALMGIVTLAAKAVQAILDGSP